MAAELDQELLLDKLSSGDRPSILALGIHAAESLKRTRYAIFAVDVLGRVQILPPAQAKIPIPKVSKVDLDALDEDSVISVMTAQGDTDDEILAYFNSRISKETPRGDKDL